MGSPTAAKPSMTLAIGPKDPARMREATTALNEAIELVKREEEKGSASCDEQGPIEPRPLANSSEEIETQAQAKGGEESESASNSQKDSSKAAKESFGKSQSTKTIHNLLIPAATKCKNVLIKKLLQDIRSSGFSDREVETCLLLFLNMDKSSKLMTAFDVLKETGESPKIKEEDESTVETDRTTCETTKVKEIGESDDVTPKQQLGRDGLISLFKCFLGSITSCLQEEEQRTITPDPTTQHPNKALKENTDSSPSLSSKSQDGDADDSTMSSEVVHEASTTRQQDSQDIFSEQTSKEIIETAIFTADRLLEHAANNRKKGSGTSSNDVISFETFGEWYNSGGFSMVPWLELLDLDKWTYTENLRSTNNLPSGNLSSIKQEPRDDSSVSTSQANSCDKPVSFDSNLATKKSSPLPNFFAGALDKDHNEVASRTVVSFDFTGAMPAAGGGSGVPPLHINITEDNLLTLRNVVNRTGLSLRQSDDIFDILLRYSKRKVVGDGSILVLERDSFGRCIRDLVPSEASRKFCRAEMESFSSYFSNFFSCFEDSSSETGPDQVKVKDLAVGFSFLCAGNKSTKLAIGFELFDSQKTGFLTPQQVIEYLQSYLTMLVGISLLSSSVSSEAKRLLMSHRANDMFAAVENGARWTYGHFEREKQQKDRSSSNNVTFEEFAQWYTEGGYTTAPWLELLDLKKFLSLVHDDVVNVSPNEVLPEPADAHYIGGSSGTPSLLGSSLESFEQRQQQPVEVLFTFPLANHRSLVVLREDATYVRSVVEQLGLLSLSPGDIWTSLFSAVRSRPAPPALPWSRPRHRKSSTGKSVDVDQATFVSCMEELVRSTAAGKKRPAPGSSNSFSTAKDTLNNFFQSFDLDQVDRVAVNQLMGGLTLLCGGKKSTKLSFAFGLFDGAWDSRKSKSGTGKDIQSLTADDLFLFLRSFLVVMFSCCKQSLDLSAAAVGRYISDTAHMVAEDVMRYQWHKRKREKVDFDDFGEWYNEGGYETAPWLELLDLKKWVLLDTFDSDSKPKGNSQNVQKSIERVPSRDYCPPPPPDDAVDAEAGFLGDLPMDDMDDMDFILMRQESHDKENDDNFSTNKLIRAQTSPKSSNYQPARARSAPSSSLKFHLVTSDDHGGYMFSISHRRVRHLKELLVESGLYKVDVEEGSKNIISKAQSGGRGDRLLKKEAFDSAMRSIVSGAPGKPKMSTETQRALSDVLTAVFCAFDRDQVGEVNAVELACGFTALCSGKKSDKLEHAFELLDEDNDGILSRRDMTRYLRSFLTVLLTVSAASCLDQDENEDSMMTLNGSRCDESAIVKAVEAGSLWATSQTLKIGNGKSERESICFDDFADWYTSSGYSSIPWLELLDLRKWVLTEQ